MHFWSGDQSAASHSDEEFAIIIASHNQAMPLLQWFRTWWEEEEVADKSTVCATKIFNGQNGFGSEAFGFTKPKRLAKICSYWSTTPLMFIFTSVVIRGGGVVFATRRWYADARCTVTLDCFTASEGVIAMNRSDDDMEDNTLRRC